MKFCFLDQFDEAQIIPSRRGRGPAKLLETYDEAEFIRSTKGGAQLKDKAGYIYNKCRTNSNGSIYWSCCDKRRYRCKARAHTEGFYIIGYVNEHSHEEMGVFKSKIEVNCDLSENKEFGS